MKCELLKCVLQYYYYYINEALNSYEKENKTLECEIKQSKKGNSTLLVMMGWDSPLGLVYVPRVARGNSDSSVQGIIHS